MLQVLPCHKKKNKNEDEKEEKVFFHTERKVIKLWCDLEQLLSRCLSGDDLYRPRTNMQEMSHTVHQCLVRFSVDRFFTYLYLIVNYAIDVNGCLLH